jgi:hypothetical protein
MTVIIFNTLFFLSSLFIAYQDFKDRLVSLWLLLIYLLNLSFFVYVQNGSSVLLENTLTTLLYLGICFAIIFIFYFAREKKIPSILDSKVGKADLIVLFAIGISLPLVLLIVFFALAFSLSALLALFFLKDKKSVPLAGILALIYISFNVFIQLFYP